MADYQPEDFDDYLDGDEEPREIAFDDEFLLEDAAPMWEKAEHIIQHDYSLNSPLISDELDNFVKYMRGEPYEPIHQRASWSDRASFLRDRVGDVWNLGGTASFHMWFPTLLDEELDLTEISDLISAVDRDAAATGEVVAAFYKGWLKELWTSTDRSGMYLETKKLGAAFLHLYRMTLFANASGKKEVETLLNTYGWTGLDPSKGEVCTNIEGWGWVGVGHGVCYIGFGRQLMDRNMLLMLKDVVGGRFQTLMHAQFKVDPPYPYSLFTSVCRVFKAGDKILRAHGSFGYRAIKRVEPLATERLHQVASSSRPRLPVLDNFKKYLDATSEEIEIAIPEAADLRVEINNISDPDTLITVYGAFRLWGHPFVNYMEGLKKLYENVTIPKVIDLETADILASNLALMKLREMFNKEKTWYVDAELLPAGHPLKETIERSAWPSAGLINEFGHHWHELPIKPCHSIPAFVPPPTVYSDRSFSIDLPEIISHIESGLLSPIPTRSVLEAFISKPATNWKEFIEMVNDSGFPPEALVIALRVKEREIKDIGRFFALMSWMVREYFVITEYLIKEFYLPLFSGLTMADDFNTVTDKMLKCSDGQGTSDYKTVTIANHLDYTKWNNHQRAEANNPVFKVMGQFLGYPNLFTRSHEIFQKSLIYYKDRPDLMQVVEGRVVNKEGAFVCWNGQDGGLEGLRQKGWTIMNYLAIDHFGRIRNTELSVLAQGDNQVLCTQYKIRESRTDAEEDANIADAFLNNQIIFDAVQAGTAKLGLIVNAEETLQSASLLLYGKVIMYRGVFKGLDEKRLGRILCTTNDQLPNLGSIAATVVTNVLMMSHYGNSVKNPITQYNWLGNFVRNIIEVHNPAIKGPVSECLDSRVEVDWLQYKCFFLFLDPSLGGVGGIALTRFLVRQFPDPITEGLSFWKLVYEHTGNHDIKRICLRAGHPRMCIYETKHLEKLIENPTGLNLPKGISVVTVLRGRIRAALLGRSASLGNEIVRDALDFIHDDKGSFLSYLETIDPLFPRFLSEFHSATYMGLVESIINLFENARTIRTKFQRDLGSDLDGLIVRSEVSSISLLLKVRHPGTSDIWACSSVRADELRETSWGRPVVGATIPHPLEMCGDLHRRSGVCDGCRLDGLRGDHITVQAPFAFPDPVDSRGPYNPYRGSMTAETTSLIQPWEKTTKVTLIRKALDMRRMITWVVEPNSNLGRAIFDNITSITAEQASGVASGYKRTGSGIHRIRTSRQEAGGFNPISPNLPTWLTVTTDSMDHLTQQNYDFMYQALLIFAQTTVIETHKKATSGQTYHLHVSCLDCVRPIEDPSLETPLVYQFPSVSAKLSKWKPADVPWFEVKELLEVAEGDWNAVSPNAKAYHIGRTLGFFFGDRFAHKWGKKDDLFPLVLRKHLIPLPFLIGISDGLLRAAAVSLLHRKSVGDGRGYKSALTGNYHTFTMALAADVSFQQIAYSGLMLDLISRGPHKIPSNYPASHEDIASVIRAFLNHLFNRNTKFADSYHPTHSDLWIFSEFLAVDVAGPFILSTEIVSILLRTPLSRTQKERLRSAARDDGQMRSGAYGAQCLTTIPGYAQTMLCPAEVRYACREIEVAESVFAEPEDEEFGEEWTGYPWAMAVDWTARKETPSPLEIPHIRDPTISGLRLSQLATGSHLKLGSLSKIWTTRIRDVLVGGDNSGGWTSRLLRMYPAGRAIFNSLACGEGIHTRGSKPSPPSAIVQMNRRIRDRCVNLETCWEDPSDLRQRPTWSNFCNLAASKSLSINGIFIDVQRLDVWGRQSILHHLLTVGVTLFTHDGLIVYKTHLLDLLDLQQNIISEFGRRFQRVYLATTDISGSGSGEVYIVAENPRTRPEGARQPNWNSVKTWMLKCPAFRGRRAEFDRARTLFNTNTLAGVPERFQPEISQEITDILLAIGVDPSQCDMLRASFQRDPHHAVEGVLALIGGAVADALKLGHYAGAKSLIPSDPKLIKIMCFIMGAAAWIALALGDYPLYDRIQEVNQKCARFHYKLQKREDRPGLYCLKWSMKTPLEGEKAVRLDSHLSFQAWVIRTLTRWSTDRVKTVNWREVDRRLQMLHGTPDTRYLCEWTGIYDIFLDDFSVEHDDCRGRWERIAIPELQDT